MSIKKVNKNYDPECPFCKLSPDRQIIIDTPGAYAIYDKFPVSKGHALIISRNHCSDYFDLTAEEQIHCWSVVNSAKKIIQENIILMVLI